jgi:hypothetical protein
VGHADRDCDRRILRRLIMTRIDRNVNDTVMLVVAVVLIMGLLLAISYHLA